MAQKIKPCRTKETSTGKFSETEKFEVLACGNVQENNNKFYCIELQRDPVNNKYRLFTHYGRIGKTNVYEIRDNYDGSPFVESNKDVIEKEYDKIIKKKKRAAKGKSSYETVDTQEPSVGSDNIRGVESTGSTASSKGDLSILNLFPDNKVKSFVKMIWDENIHNITNMTTMKVTSSGIASPLGPLTLSHIDLAGGVLGHIKDAYQRGDSDVSLLNSQYFSMIPHPFGMKIPDGSMIDDDNKFMVEFDLLEQMKSAIKVGGSDATDEQIDNIGLDIDIVEENSDLWKSLNKQYVESRATCHSHLNGWNIKNIFVVDHNESTDRYTDLDRRFKTTEFDLFHGSMPCNILSIMMNGLMVPPKTAGHVTGRLFGDGVYAASASTKALNYSTGYWSRNNTPKFDNAYIFVVRMAMGRIFHPKGTLYSGPPTGYDSTWARADDTNLANDEFICYKTEQVKITHLLEIGR